MNLKHLISALSIKISRLIRYEEVEKTGNSYTVEAADIQPNGVSLLTLTNATAIACALPTPTALGKNIGESFSIVQGGAGVITVTAGAFVGAKTTATTATFTHEGEIKTFIAKTTTTWRVVGA